MPIPHTDELKAKGKLAGFTILLVIGPGGDDLDKISADKMVIEFIYKILT